MLLFYVFFHFQCGFFQRKRPDSSPEAEPLNGRYAKYYILHLPIIEGEEYRISWLGLTMKKKNLPLHHKKDWLRRKLRTISVRLDFLKCVQIFIFFKSKSRHIYLVSRHANLDTHMCPDFLKCVYIFIIFKSQI